MIDIILYSILSIIVAALFIVTVYHRRKLKKTEALLSAFRAENWEAFANINIMLASGYLGGWIFNIKVDNRSYDLKYTIQHLGSTSFYEFDTLTDVEAALSNHIRAKKEQEKK